MSIISSIKRDLIVNMRIYERKKKPARVLSYLFRFIIFTAQREESVLRFIE